MNSIRYQAENQYFNAQRWPKAILLMRIQKKIILFICLNSLNTMKANFTIKKLRKIALLNLLAAGLIYQSYQLSLMKFLNLITLSLISIKHGKNCKNITSNIS